MHFFVIFLALALTFSPLVEAGNGHNRHNRRNHKQADDEEQKAKKKREEQERDHARERANDDDDKVDPTVAALVRPMWLNHIPEEEARKYPNTARFIARYISVFESLLTNQYKHVAKTPNIMKAVKEKAMRIVISEDNKENDIDINKRNIADLAKSMAEHCP